MRKYKVKRPEADGIKIWPQVCITCGKRQNYEQPIYKNSKMPRPRPNTTPMLGDHNRLNCWAGSHAFYFLDEVEENG